MINGFIYSQPSRYSCGILFNSPHSGCDYAREFLARTRLSLENLRYNEDYAVNELFSNVVSEGMSLLEAVFPRSFIDLNREPFELDTHLIEEPLPLFANARTPRVLAGLGTVPRVILGGRAIYDGKLSLEEALIRIESYYRPYHRQLKAILTAMRHEWGEALLIDCHSMPSAASSFDIILGDCHGVSAGGDIMRLIEDILTEQGYRVGRNNPYAGGFITEHYGQPRAGIHAVQIELSRGLYMNEETLAKKPHFAQLQADLTWLACELRDYYLSMREMAAE